MKEGKDKMPSAIDSVPISFTRLRFVPNEFESCQTNSIVEAATELSLRSPDFDAIAHDCYHMDLVDDSELNIQILISQVFRESDD